VAGLHMPQSWTLRYTGHRYVAVFVAGYQTYSNSDFFVAGFLWPLINFKRVFAHVEKGGHKTEFFVAGGVCRPLATPDCVSLFRETGGGRG